VLVSGPQQLVPVAGVISVLLVMRVGGTWWAGALQTPMLTQGAQPRRRQAW
jgi:hypothetical protein